MGAEYTKITFIQDGTGALGFAFEDFDGNARAPNTFYWTLTDADGNVINSREGVEETPDTTVYVVLSGDDLAISEGGVVNQVMRYITIYGEHDTTIGGTLYSDKPYKHQFSFILEEYGGDKE